MHTQSDSPPPCPPPSSLPSLPPLVAYFAQLQQIINVEMPTCINTCADETPSENPREVSDVGTRSVIVL